MTQEIDFLKALVKILEDAGIPYMLCGSVGSSFYGQPRATNDADIVIAPTDEQIQAFIKSIGKNYYINQQTAFDALKQSSMFNIIDMKTGRKADFIIRKKRPFSTEEFERRRSVNMAGLKVWIASVEDVILSKLEWSKDSQSSQQFKDALNVAIVQWENLDKNYLYKWAQELGVADILKKLLEQTENSI